jgi:cytochrome c oxidase assembly protein subunit 15
MTDLPADQPLIPRWLHAWAAFTAAATVGLLTLGGMVTTFRVGMADAIWPTTPWHLFVYYEPSAGYVIEHSHRIAGWLVGFCTIVLAAGLWWSAPKRSLGWLGLAALVGVSLQGVLGGLRVRLNEWLGTDLAALHGIFGQVVFTLLVSLAALTARRQPAGMDEDQAKRLWRIALLVPALVFLQLVFGALLRHTYSPLAQRAHLLTAFAVVAGVVWLVKIVVEGPSLRKPMGDTVALLAVLVVLQLLLGVEAWLKRFTAGSLPEAQKVTIPLAVVWTGHQVVGSWILATSAVVALKAYRMLPAKTTRTETRALVGPVYRPAAPTGSLERTA